MQKYISSDQSKRRYLSVCRNWRREPSRPKIGVALSGGAAKGVAHIGVLKALCDAGIAIDMVSGSSVGTLAGSFFAFGAPFDVTYRQAAAMSILKVAKPVFLQKGLFSNKIIGEIVRNHLGEANIQDADVPLAIVAADVQSGELIALREGNLARAVMASCAIPCLFKPIEIEGRLLVDGGVVDNLGVTPLRQMGADIVIAVNLCPEGVYRKVNNAFDVMMNACRIAMNRNTRALEPFVDVMIVPDLSQYSTKDPQWAEKYFKAGYEAARSAVDQIKKFSEDWKKPEMKLSRNLSNN